MHAFWVPHDHMRFAEVLEFGQVSDISGELRAGRPLVRIKPSTAIRQDYTGLADLCHSIDEPVVLTRNGEADLVVMSYEAYQRAEARVKLQARLLAADRQAADSTALLDAVSVFDRIRARIDDAEA